MVDLLAGDPVLLAFLVMGAAPASALSAAVVPLVPTVVASRDAVEAAGMLAGIETQPAALAHARERTAGDVRIGRPMPVVPAAMLATVVAIQLLV